MLRHARLPWVIVALGLLAADALPVVADTPYRVIVHANVKGKQIPRAALSSIFLKEARRWGDGSAVLPVDQSLRSPIRFSFCREVLRQDIEAVSFYWQRRMAAGVMPPMVKSSDEEIIAFVASTPGAIGYVSADIALPDSVRAITIVD
jgi:ABC-type phosphate transport system substrate-binding protein